MNDGNTECPKCGNLFHANDPEKYQLCPDCYNDWADDIAESVYLEMYAKNQGGDNCE